ncbi:unnamed protein product [Ambrosiozyma monospora]|uniref:Unnamed protein product n=1 Tax=Ambrosiozyma monospora TaxID=43982 RepID=A0ACB5TPX2_AMBMO|nr:unnamed protein product [Ambrosiozyma monospora]
MAQSVPLNKGDNFTFESEDSTKPDPIRSPINFDVSSPNSTATSPLKINIYSKKQVDELQRQQQQQDSNSSYPANTVTSATTPKQDYNYLMGHLSPMPGSWITKQHAKFEEQDKEFLDPAGTKFDDYINSPDSSPMSLKVDKVINGQLEDDPLDHIPDSINNNSNSKYDNDDDDKETYSKRTSISSQRPVVPEDAGSTSLPSNAYTKMRIMGESLTNALGISSSSKSSTNASTNPADISSSSSHFNNTSTTTDA